MLRWLLRRVLRRALGTEEELKLPVAGLQSQGGRRRNATVDTWMVKLDLPPYPAGTNRSSSSSSSRSCEEKGDLVGTGLRGSGGTRAGGVGPGGPGVTRESQLHLRILSSRPFSA